MSAPMSQDEILRSLIAQGVPPRKAEQAAGFFSPTVDLAAVAAHLRPALPLPVRLTLPWSALCPDNEREAAGLTMRGGKPVPRKVMTARYRSARERVIAIAKAVMAHPDGQYAPLDVPLALVARVYTPTQRRVDVANFAKGVHDALNRLVYTDDNWLYDVRWVRVGMDMDHPRAELEVTPL